MKQFITLAIALAMMASSASVEAKPASRAVTLTCPGEKGTTVVVPVGGKVVGKCPGKIKKVLVEIVQPTDEGTTGGQSSIGDWDLGIQTSWTGVRNVNLISLEGIFSGHLRMYRDLMYFTADLGGGVGWIDSKINATITEFIGFEFRKNWFMFDVGARHRVAFVGDGDTINALMAEVQFHFRIIKGLILSVSGGFGGAWFPEEVKSKDLIPAGVQVPTEIQLGSGRAGTVGLKLEWRF